MSERLKLYREGTGEPISLLHGWGMNASIFQPLSKKLQTDFQVFRADLPGYGQSVDLGGLDFDAQVAFLAEELPESTLLGWSMGGLYAIRLAMLYPNKFKKLVLVASNPCFVHREDWSSAMDAAVFNDFADSLIDDWKATIRRFIGLQVHGVDQARLLIRRISELLIQGGVPDPEVLRFGLDLLLTQDLRAELQQLQVPVMVILGGRDKLVPYSLADQLRQLMSSIRVECLPRSAHAPFLSDTQQFVELLDEFIKSTQAG